MHCDIIRYETRLDRSRGRAQRRTVGPAAHAPSRSAHAGGHLRHSIDNSRLVKAPDPVRARQMRIFAAAITVLFSLIMVYGLQHFYAIENSYRVEAEKQVRDQLREENRQLRLTEAELTQPGRIDGMARQLGLGEAQPGQVVPCSFAHRFERAGDGAGQCAAAKCGELNRADYP